LRLGDNRGVPPLRLPVSLISVVLYGRNDSHGYNLHRRAALSLNCLAEVLTDPDDEIVFVDYNTPDELPTFVESIADTLTERCLDLLRVLRVPAALHEERFGGRTHLPAVEPVARNAAVRRANPSNRWLLSTNTDMILLPLRDRSLSDVVRDLPDGYYGLPRFELPEWLWERLPRADPQRALAEVARLGPNLRLDEPTTSIESMRFDAAGDFQLILRSDFVAVDGFDEEMLLGYHVDSNFAQRMFLRGESIGTLEEDVAGYHCNHFRTPTVYHIQGRVENDFERFVFALDQAELPGQRNGWGLADVDIEEIDPRRGTALSVADSLLAAMPDQLGTRSPSDALRIAETLTYDSAHVFPFVADLLLVSPPSTAVCYLGANPTLEQMLASLVERLFGVPLDAPDLEDPASIEAAVEKADVFVVDLGIDASRLAPTTGSRSDRELALLPVRLDLAFDALERLVELERARLGDGKRPRPVVLVNSTSAYCDAFVLAELNCSYTTPHSRVRRAQLKPEPDAGEASRAAVARCRSLRRWSVRSSGPMRLELGETASLSEPEDWGGFGEGWATPDEWGIWTQGSSASVAVAFGEADPGNAVLVLTIGNACVQRDDALTVDLLLNGSHVATRDFGRSDLPSVWRIDIREQVLARRTAELVLAVHEPRSPRELGWLDDPRPLGLHLSALSFEPRWTARRRALLRAARRYRTRIVRRISRTSSG
jgi:hypothetical protein